MKQLKSALFAIILLPIIGSAQVINAVVKEQMASSGIKFEEGLSWSQIKAKAEKENKSIFVDCYATWCGPCKQMDKDIYPLQEVGDAYNPQFVSVKVQMDSTSKDDDFIKSWYRDVKKIKEQYKVKEYPTYLFFSPNGTFVHKSIGGYGKKEFIALASDALDPNKQYVSLLNNYLHGKKDYSKVPYLLRITMALHDEELSQKMVADYMGNYLSQLNDKELFTKENMNFIFQYNQSSKTFGFKLFNKNVDKINKMMQMKDYVQRHVQYIIYKEELTDLVFIPASLLAKENKKIVDPEWDKIGKRITQKYNLDYSTLLITKAKVNWYSWRKNWKEYAKNALALMDFVYGKKSLEGKAFDVNNDCWNIFELVTDINVLNRAIKWMEQLFQEDKGSSKWPTAMDTYANLLYKVGRINEALDWQKKTVQIATDINWDAIMFEQTLEKMQNGEPTWPQDRKNFSGTWKLNLQKSEYGEAPFNTLINKIKVDQKNDSITIERFAGEAGNEIYGTETLSFSGKTSETVVPGNAIKSAKVKWSSNGEILTEVADYNYEDDEMDRKVIEVWSLSEEGRLLTVTRDVELKSGSKYFIKTVYEKK